jgi:hypothetical protein
MDKFSKWIEARPISKIKSEQAVMFFTDIIHRFGFLIPSLPTTACNSLVETSVWTGQ